ncbi:tRNA pseudouridine(38-40) synthase TruA [Elizabethkingia sp. JS20170427COW]|uniref:tRNA pseudouridine(38-40) synthase TruA n=1 Tax=Elizabethkingia sp. JS20170427COW TaxID=2583851 RepID=UPI0011101F80|nr:tRNA pseudouridine(38-40) synthase TruA [Elizabethkingia sp. JS20170427COW]QCX52721.1 tRNA pseudouridine(38-40) synthase TruA [Elizabethkingia sp. JS20170427COW]
MRIENLDKNTNKSRYFIAFSYNGASFFGFQIQPNEISVQETMEKAMSTLLREEIKIVGAGRTDTGVHAKKIYAHFEIEKPLPTDLVKRLNSFLPPSIAVKEIFSVPSDMHARFSALYRTYEYYISPVKDPFTENSAWQYWRKPLDVAAMNEACKILFQYRDFTSFAKLHADTKTNICEIKKAYWEEQNGVLKFTISADRFLRNMVRAIVGTMVEVGSGKIQPKDLHNIIEKKHRNAAGTSAPAHGLYLVDVGYNFEH